MSSSPLSCDDWQKVGSHVVISKPEYEFEIDEFRRGDDQMVFVHMWVLDWSKSVLRDMLAAWKIFRQCVTCPLYAVAEIDDDKWTGYVSLFGFKPLTEVVLNNGEHRRLFIHRKQENNEQLQQARTDAVPVVRHEPLVGADSVPVPGVHDRRERAEHGAEQRSD